MSTLWKAALALLLIGAAGFWLAPFGIPFDPGAVSWNLDTARGSANAVAGVLRSPEAATTGGGSPLTNRAAQAPTPVLSVAAGFHFKLVTIDPVDDYEPRSVVVGDVTGDSRPDVVASFYSTTNHSHPYSVRIYEQLPNGAISRPTQIDLPFVDHVSSIGIELADLDGDGLHEIVVGHAGYDTGLMVIAKVGKDFVVTTKHSGSAEGTYLAAVDIDGDGHQDVFAQGWEYGADIYFGDGRGGISRVEHVDTSFAAYPTVEASDFTGDGRNDILVQTGDIVRIYPSDGGPISQSPSVIDLAPYVTYDASGMAVADMNHDGRPDLVITDQGDRGIPLPSGVRILYRGVGDGFSEMQYLITTGQDPTQLWITDTPAAVQVADVDGNGYPDIITMFSGWNRMGYFLQGPAGFDRLVTMITHSDPWVNSHYFDKSFAIADINSDGCPDIVLAEVSSSLRAFYGRNCQRRAMRTGGPLPPRRR